jgi:hypothetical protein
LSKFIAEFSEKNEEEDELLDEMITADHIDEQGNIMPQ